MNPPKGWRRLQVGELIEANDVGFAGPEDVREEADMEGMSTYGKNSSYIGRPVDEYNAVYRKLESSHVRES